MSSEAGPDPIAALEEEIGRIQGKRQEIKDPFIRDALDQKIAHLQKRVAVLKKPKVEPEEQEPDEVFVPPTPQQLEVADGLIRQARVEKMRNNALGATELLRKAAESAPTAPAVLEALADNLVEQRKKKEAIPLYKRAIKLDPTNVGLERKHAMLVLGSSMGGVSFEDAMRSDWSPAGPAPEGMASPLAATILTVFMPGLGHIVLGRTWTGVTILGIWATCCFWLGVRSKDVIAFTAQISGRNGGHVGYLILVPMLVLAIVYIAAINSLRVPKRTSGRSKIDHPVPPVNLPFE